MILETASSTSAGGMGGVVIIVYLVLFVGLMYFMIVRPQKKQQKQMEDLHNSMEPGDTVMTTGGFYGTLLDIVDDTTVIVEFGNDRHCRIPMHKNAIAEVEKAGSAVVKDDEVDSDEGKNDSKLGKEKK
ncbi:MAG: preprotein translocase subunit YajC [Lachnospiraceae bacterium]|nr:preprotein translocase subunit YajC [Lachnospiraceae bacterium]